MIYVDKLFIKELADTQGQALGAIFGHKWCHLWCDLEDEEALHAMADGMGLPRSSYLELPRGSHYLLTPVKREQALRHGAHEGSYIGWLAKNRARLEAQSPSLFPDLP